MMRRPALLMALAFLLLPAAVTPARARVLMEEWVKTPGGSPDGTALGDVDGDGRLEIALVLRGGSYAPGMSTPGIGTFVLLNADGSVRFSVQTGQQLGGFPVFGDFDGDSFDEVAFCEVSQTGHCRAYDGDGTLMFSVGPFWFPAMTNGGPIAADIDNDGYDDLIVVSYGGEVNAFKGPSGALAYSYDLWISQSDWPFGHAAVGDIDGDKKLEIVIGGAQRGGFYVLNAENGTLQWAVNNLYASYKNYFHGSGPVLVNLDADPALEVVGAMAGYDGPSALVALDTNGSLLWRNAVSEDSFIYTSPAAADTDGDGLSELFVQGFSGNLFKFRASNGVRLGETSLGAASWSTPAFLDINFDGTMEIVTSTLSAAYILNGTLAQVDRYDNPNSGLFPPPIIGDTDADGTLELITGAWYPQQFVSIPLPYTSAFSWSAFEGSARHTGAAPIASPEILLGNDPAPASAVVLNEIVNAANATTGNVRTQLRNARGTLDGAYRSYLQGDPHLAVDKIRQTINYVESARNAGYPTKSATEIEQELAYIGLLILDQYIDRSRAIIGPTQQDIRNAETAYANAQNQYGMARYPQSIGHSDEGAEDLRYFLDNGNYTVANFCPTAVPEVYMAWECRINGVRDQVKALLVTNPGNSALTNADTQLRRCVVWAPDLVFDEAYPYCKAADSYLALFTKQDISGLRNQVAFAIMRNTRLYIDDAVVWFRTFDPSAIATAEAAYNSGVSQYDSSNYQPAHQSFVDAYTAARPCAGSSFNTPANGLTGGGCSP